MDSRAEIREFLASRRARLTPAQVGLPTHGTRRVKGLRREEVALLAGVSPDYYIRLERGGLSGASPAVIDALARALRLDETERGHLFDLAQAGRDATGRRLPRSRSARVRPEVQRMLDAIMAPAVVRNARADVLATNQLGSALYAPVFDDPVRPANTARFAFLDPRARDFYVGWEQTADNIAARLRAEAGRNPLDRGLTDLVGELCMRSPDFAARWARHDVFAHRAGEKRLHHPVVGALDLNFEAMQLTADPQLTLIIYTADAGSKSQDALDLLASWSASLADPAPSER
ncbi:helix-turn-helix domain-containing protein [Microlunatus speluncae]|uniref:helix-turn-helix domain-containing protein n=1 Tax=Microlunatus speluncae TaxID=2594267 RepID=UPI0012667B83|nr:helix-turn-helix transcriptional regulator [Microlunatus speluncae]